MPISRWLLVLSIPAALFVLYLALLAMLWWTQERLIFYPSKLPAGYVLAREPDVHELTVPQPGATLSALHLRLPEPRGVVFFLHGNAGNLASWFTDTEFYRRENLDLVMMDYRGFGKSEGQIQDAQQLRSDVRAVWNRIAPLYEGKKHVLYGRSLGTALAADLGAQLTREGRPPALTVLVSAYTSFSDLMGEFYPWVPRPLLRYRLDTAAALQHVGGPVLLLHGSQDKLISPAHSERIKKGVPRAELVLVAGASHNDIQPSPHYTQALRAALARL